MTDRLLKTKLHVPITPARLVARVRLTDQLVSGITGRLSVISAPAGSGKTTLVCDFIRQIKRPVAWVSLDSSDDNLSRFLSYVVAALTGIKVKVSDALQSLIESPQQQPDETTATILINDLASLTEPIIVVLDDYHVIKSEIVHTIVTFLLNNLPPTVHIVITSRTRTPLSLSRLRARGQLTELQIADLRFTDDEATEFLRRTMNLDLEDRTIAALETRTEGWIAGLQLAALSLRKINDQTEFLKTFSGRNNYVLDYLVDEVISQQPEHVQSFLLQTSILNRLTSTLCDALTGQNDGQATLMALEQANLFIVPLDNERRWYRYHHLFADFLLDRAKESIGNDGLADLHQRSSDWHRTNGLSGEAIRHSLAAKDFDTAAEIIEKSADEMYSRGDLSTLRRWLESLPEETRRSRPRSSIYYAWTLLQVGEGTGADDAVYGIAEDYLRFAAISVSKPSNGLASREEELGMVYAVRTWMASWRPVRKSAFCAQKDLSNIIRCGQQSLARLRSDNLVWRCVVNIGLGLAYRYIGSIRDATTAFAEASRHGATSGNLAGALFAHCNWAQLLIQQGTLYEAEHVYREGLRLAASRNGDMLPVTGQIYIGLGLLFYEWNNLGEAAKYLSEGIRRAETGAAPTPDALLRLARVRVLQNDNAAAQELSEQALEMMNLLDIKISTLNQARIEQAMLMLAEQNIPAAVKWATTFGPGLNIDPDPWIEQEYIALGRVMTAKGDAEKIVPALELLRKDAQASGRKGSQIGICTVLASAYRIAGNGDLAGARLIETLRLAEQNGYTRTFLDEGESIVAPLNKILHELREDRSVGHGLSREYVERLLVASKGQSGAVIDAKVIGGIKANLALIEPLSDRELEIMSLIAAGHSNQEIADKSFVALCTVKWHINNIYGKLQVTSRTQAILRSQQLGLV